MVVEANEWAVRRRLERVQIDLVPGQMDRWSLKAQGIQGGKRKPLWTYTEDFGPVRSDLGLSDACAHIVLVCMQDRPSTLERLEQGLCGGRLYFEDGSQL